MLKVIAYTGGASGLFRVSQYIEPLRGAGIDMCECRARSGSHPPAGKWMRPLWGVCNLSERAVDTARSLAYDAVFFQREMLSTFVTWERFARRPRILDVDDAVWAHPRGGFARRLASLCDHVICGNRFLAQQFSEWNPRVSILPTPVDVHRFHPRAPEKDPERMIIGWMGLYSNLVYLSQIESALAEVLRRHPRCIFRVVSSQPPKLPSLPAGQLEYIVWSPENEVRTMQEMTIGIMPLEDTVFARGKCSFKMLLYMACGLPVVVSPVGMNAEVLHKDNVGFSASNESEWVEHLDTLLRDPALRSRMGAAGRKVVSENYSVEVLAPKLAQTLRNISGTPA
jgi:glycosyltransferase involved in cell wall biosynthesis